MTSKKKRSDEIAVEIKEHDKIYKDQLEESKKIIDIQQKEYEYHIAQSKLEKAKAGQIDEKLKETKAEQAVRCGKILERYKLVPKDEIIRELAKDFKGYISREWINSAAIAAGKEWARKYVSEGKYGKPRQIKSAFNLPVVEPQPLTPQEKQYKEAVERELITDKTIQKLIYEWTNKTTADQGSILEKTAKGKHWSLLLAEESTDYMRRLAYQMTISALQRRLEDIRIIKNVADKFGDILYEVFERRKQTESLESA